METQKKEDSGEWIKKTGMETIYTIEMCAWEQYEPGGLRWLRQGNITVKKITGL